MSLLLSVPAGALALLLIDASPFGLPPNLRLDPALEPVAIEMWHGSPTFRRQCARLAAEPRLVVAVWYDQGLVRHQHHRAVTTFVRHAGRLVTAQVRLGRGHDPVELLAHELEHIVEQLDGVDLARAVRTSSGVRRTADGTFETERAIRAGRQAQRETQMNTDGRHR